MFYRFLNLSYIAKTVCMRLQYCLKKGQSVMACAKTSQKGPCSFLITLKMNEESTMSAIDM